MSLQGVIGVLRGKNGSVGQMLWSMIEAKVHLLMDIQDMTKQGTATRSSA
jgi:hypothetical protein